MTDDLLTDGVLDKLQADLAAPPAPVGWTALPPSFSDRPLPGVGYWERPGPGWPWRRVTWLDVWWCQWFGVGGQYVRIEK